MAASPRNFRVRCRKGNTFTFSLVAIVVVTALAGAGYWMFGRGGSGEGPELITNTVSKGPYDYVVIEQGTVESAKNVELRCEVRSRGGGGGSSGGDRGGGGLGGTSTTIIWVIAEGTMVKGPVKDEDGNVVEPGEVVVELDKSSLELEETQQQLTVINRRSLAEQAKNTLAANEIARVEYLEGNFKSQDQQIQVEVFVAEQALRNASSNLEAAKSLMAKGIVTALQVESAQFAFDNANKQREVAETRLATLRDYTKQKTLKDLDSAIATAKANLDAQMISLQLEESRLEAVQDQIRKCTIRAPEPGQVVYANQYDRYRGSSSTPEFIVTEGAMVRERQAIIRLPNAQDMQVKATVNEARVTLVRPGLPVSIRIDALKDEIIEGVVTKVNQYAEAGGFSSGNIKRYATFVKILNPPQELRVGMNAEVRIHVERKHEALQVPVQALAEHKGHFFSLVKTGDKFTTHEVKISSTNDKVATIENGLAEGDEVVMNPRGAGGLLILPDLPDPMPAQIAGDIQKVETGPITFAVATPGKGAPDGGGGPGGEKGKGKGGAGFNPASIVDRALQENDEDKDGKISVAELAKMDDRRRDMLDGADKNKDGFMDKTEMLAAVSASMQRRREQGGGGKGGGNRGGGRGGDGGPPGPAGGGE